MPYKEKDNKDDSDTSTNSSVRCIPMPPGSPPEEHLEIVERTDKSTHRRIEEITATVEDSIDERRKRAKRRHSSEVKSPEVASPQPAQTVYMSAPVLRDLKKEALKFVPKNVQRNAPSSEYTVPTVVEREASLTDTTTPEVEINSIQDNKIDPASAQETNSGASMTPVLPRRRLNIAP